MFLYMVMPGRDTQDELKQMVNYLANQFKVPNDSYEYTSFDPKLMKTGKNRKLFILGHGSTNSYMGQSAEVMYRFLEDQGLSAEYFSEIWLMPCLVGEQKQDNSVTKNFARDFKTELHQREKTQNIKLYAPRGPVVATYAHDGSCTDVCVDADGKEYGFHDGGWLLVGGSGTW